MRADAWSVRAPAAPADTGRGLAPGDAPGPAAETFREIKAGLARFAEEPRSAERARLECFVDELDDGSDDR